MLAAARTLGAAARRRRLPAAPLLADAGQAREFGAALAAADVVVVTEIYEARERAEDFPGVSACSRRGGRRRKRRRTGRLDADASPTRRRYVAPDRRAGDLVLTIGAGNVDALGHALTGPPAA